MEDGTIADTASIQVHPCDEAGINVLEKWMLHALDLGANYWSLWTESANLAHIMNAIRRLRHSAKTYGLPSPSSGSGRENDITLTN